MEEFLVKRINENSFTEAEKVLCRENMKLIKKICIMLIKNMENIKEDS